MIDAEFESIIKKMANEMGKTIFAESKFKALLKDYTKNEFEKERDLLLKVINAGCVKYINETKNLAECKQALIKRLEDDYSLSTSKSGEMLDLLILILRGEKAETTVAVEPPKEKTAKISTQKEEQKPKSTEKTLQTTAVRPQQSASKNDVTLKIGSILPFGSYKWRVLDVQGDEALIITEDVIEKRPYNEKYSDVTWETCELRKYLNSEFLQKFTKEQQGQIAETTNHNPKNLWYGTPGGRDTMDKIFLLSLEEADRYFGDCGDYLNKRRKRMEQHNNDRTLIADNEGQYFSNNHDKDRVANYGSKGACAWWLRSPGRNSNYAAGIGYGGYVGVHGNYLSIRTCGVRPALWLKV